MEDKSEQKKLIIGASDIIDLPSLKLQNISCKIDTGADTSAIHTYHVQIITKNDYPVLQFRVLDPSHPLYVKRVFNFKN
ncbi:MAG: peptidase, partial [Raineya sp.]